jgi:ADP-ribose pyrophosphatase YjhB (NUDIX family)
MNSTKSITCVDHYGISHEIEISKFQFRISVYGILEKDNSILFVKSKWIKLWEFPGGGVKIYESIPQALVREFQEETGLIVKPQKFLSVKENYFYAEDRDQAWHTVCFFYSVNLIDGKLITAGNTQDVIEAGFIPKADSKSTKFNPYIQRELESYLSNTK